MGLRIEHLDTDVIRSRVQMVLHTSANRFHVIRCHERVDQTVAALPDKVVSAEPPRGLLLRQRRHVVAAEADRLLAGC
jgi:hypothetical protein